MEVDLSDFREKVPDWDNMPTRDRILMAAREEFVERGFEGARVQRIAEVCGANKAMIYYYFGDKRELYFRVISAVLSTAVQSLAGIAATEKSPGEKLRSVARFYTDFYGHNQDFLRLIMREFANRGPRMEDLLEKLGDSARRYGFPQGLAAVVEEGNESGEFRNVDPRQTIMSLVSMCAGYFMLKPVANLFLGISSDEEEDEFVDRRAGEIADLLLAGITAGGNERSGR
jgi:AcrR family transcriptional regulator